MSGRPDFQVMPALSDADYEALRKDVAERGVLVPVEYDEAGNVLDGHHRVRACEELGIANWPRVTRRFATEADKFTHARQLNLARRHLSPEQRRELIAAELCERPERSNRQIASDLGVDHKTVGDAREALQRTGEIPQLDRTVGADGKSRPAARPKLEAVDFNDLSLGQRRAGQGGPEWYTPPAYIELARSVLGEIDLDPASCAPAQAIVRAARYFTKEDDGLAHSWCGRVWLNPPYAQPLISEFVSKLVAEFRERRTTRAILLANGACDTSWFHEAANAASALCFPRGRLDFRRPDGTGGSPLQGQAVFYLGPAPEHFAEVFGHLGLMLKKWGSP